MEETANRVERYGTGTGVDLQAEHMPAPGGRVFNSTPTYQFLYANNDWVAYHERRYTTRGLWRKLLASRLEPVKLLLVLTSVLFGHSIIAIARPGSAT